MEHAFAIGQKFYLQKQNDGSYKIGTGYTGALSVIESNKSQKRWTGTNSQKWTISPNGNYFTIKNKSTGKFLSFSGSGTNVTLNVNTTASLWKLQPFNEKYTVTFKDENEKVLSRQSIKNGSSAIAPTAPEKKGFRFTGWDKEFSKVKSNLLVKPKYIQQFTVNFIDEALGTNLLKNTNNKEASEINNNEGGWAIVTGGTGKGEITTLNNTPIAGQLYGFKISENTGHRDWAQRMLPLEEGKTYKAEAYVRVPSGETSKATIRFYDNINKKMLYSMSKDITGTNWQKISLDINNFAGSEDVSCQFGLLSDGDIEYCGMFLKEITNKKTLKTQVVDKGAVATAPTNPTRTGYTFNGWSESLTITKKTDLYATYKPKTAKVIFHINIPDDTRTYTESYSYGIQNQEFGMKLINKTGEFGVWKRNHYQLLGWSENPEATEKEQRIYATVTDAWINKKAGTVNFYAVWKGETGWNGNYYYKDGKPLKGFHKIGDTYYIFDKNTGKKLSEGKQYFMGVFWQESRNPIEPAKINLNASAIVYLTLDGKNLYPIDGANDFEKIWTNRNDLINNHYNGNGVKYPDKFRKQEDQNYPAQLRAESVIYKNGYFYFVSPTINAKRTDAECDFIYNITQDFKTYEVHKGSLTTIIPENKNDYNEYFNKQENKNMVGTENDFRLNTENRWAPESFYDDGNFYVFTSMQTNISKHPDKINADKEVPRYKHNIYMSKSKDVNQNGKIETGEWDSGIKCEFLDANGGKEGIGAMGVGIGDEIGNYDSFIDAQVFKNNQTYYMVVKRDEGGLKWRYVCHVLYKADKNNFEKGKWKFVKALGTVKKDEHSDNLFNEDYISYNYNADKLSPLFTGQYKARGRNEFEAPSITKIGNQFFLYTDHYIYNGKMKVSNKIGKSKYYSISVQYDGTIHYAIANDSNFNFKYNKTSNEDDYIINAYRSDEEGNLIKRGYATRHGSITEMPEDAFAQIQKAYNIKKNETDISKEYSVIFTKSQINTDGNSVQADISDKIIF